MNPGITVLPVTSITCASGGMATSPPRPMALKRSPSMTMTEFSIGGRPVPSISVPPRITSVSACAVAANKTAVANAAHPEDLATIVPPPKQRPAKRAPWQDRRGFAGLWYRLAAMASLRQRRCLMRRRRRSAHGLCGARDFGEAGELAVLVAAGLDDAGRHQKLHRLLDRDVEFDHVVARHIEEKAGGRIRRAWHEGGDVLGLRQPCRNL